MLSEVSYDAFYDHDALTVEVAVSHPRAGVATCDVELDTEAGAADGGRR